MMEDGCALADDDDEIMYWAAKLGIDPDLDDWDVGSHMVGLASITRGITAARVRTRGDEVVGGSGVAVRSPEEEATRREFTGLLNRITRSNYAAVGARIHEVYRAHSSELSGRVFCHCISHRVLSDTPLPALFLEVYARITSELPCLQAVVEGPEGKEGPNVVAFRERLGVPREGVWAGSDGELQLRWRAARAAGITTERGMAIFNAVVGAMGVDEAWAALQRIGGDADWLLVVIRIGLSEAQFNAFYPALLAKAGAKELKRAFKATFAAAESRDVRMNRIAGLMAASVALEHEVGLSLWRGTRMRELRAQGQLIGKVFFREVLMRSSDERCLELFGRVCDSSGFRADLRFFVSKIVRPFLSESDSRVKRRLSAALGLLRSSGGGAGVSNLV